MAKRPFLMRARRSAAALTVAAIAAAGAISGCGASQTIDPVAKAADLSNASPGYRMTFAMQVDSGSLLGAVTVNGSGSVNPARHTGSFAMAMALHNSPAVNQLLGSGGLRMQEVLKGTTVYIRLPPALSSRIPGASGKPWLKVDLKKLGGSQASALGALAANPLAGDPSQLLEYLRGSGAMKKVAKEQVAGISTTHYRGHIDLDQVGKRLPSAQRQAVQHVLRLLNSEGFAKQLPVDVWVDGHGLVRQMQMRMSASPTGQ